MDDTRTMAQLLEAPTVGYEDAIVVPEITADNFELKHGLLTLIQNKQFFGHDKEDPHAHIRYFNKITSTIKFPNVPSSGTLPSNTITNPKVDLKGITTRSGVAYQGPTIPTTSFSPSKVVERETEVTKDTVPPTNKGSTKYVQPPVVQVQPQVLNSEPVVAPVSALMPNLKPSIPYPTRCNDERGREKANDQIEKFYKIFQDISFEISLADALILMPKFASTLKALIGNKEKFSEMARTPLNEHCSVCLALADLGASINLVLLSVWKKLSLPELTPTCMTLELADRSITQPIGIAKDVNLKVGKFKFQTDFVVVDFDANPRVPLILGRSFLKTGRALIDVYEGELTLRVGKEAVTFNLDQTSRYSSNYDDNSVNRIDVIEMACEDDFLLEEVDAFLALEDDLTLPLPKKGGFTVVENDENELIPTRLVTGWHVCIDYRKLNEATRKDHFPLPFMDQMLEILARNEYYFSMVSQVTFKFPSTLMIKKRQHSRVLTERSHTIACLLAYAMHRARSKDKMLQRCGDTNLCLNWEKSHFMFKEGIVLGHKIFKKGIEVDKAKIDVIAKLPHPTTVKGVQSFLGHAGRVRVAREDDCGVTEGREDVHEVFKQRGSRAKRKAYLDVEGIEWMLYRGVGRRSEAKNEFEIDVLRSDLGLRKGYWWHKIRCPKQRTRQHKLVPSCFAIFTFEPLTMSLTSIPSCDLVSLTNILILCLILKASNQSLRNTFNALPGRHYSTNLL
ncbi:reverse transcriptase domain-containing protein [Tanacetum coccineum]|uniref:Reverse transcriptase domain-containing protein n=1 Tax=Tanacetum coccineum TaxID=301880 RepID=A0ABQ5I0S9_9ASTR